jgi:HAD superfamily hydrolase (TIGR01549 family)
VKPDHPVSSTPFIYKAVVFDLDGTLVDTPLCFESIRAELGIPEDEFILEFLNGLPAVERHAKMQRLEEIELHAAEKAQPFNGVSRLLTELKEKSVNIGILTRNCRRATDHVIRAHAFDIDLSITREDAPPKPDPAGIEKFLASWKIQRTELLFVGDFRFDIECGRNAGVRTALFTNNGPPTESLTPDHVVKDFTSFWQSLASAAEAVS